MEYQHTLPAGTELIGTYRIVRLLGSGGFANTYLAEDRTLHREVAIKEYFPNDFAVRSGRTGVQVKTAAHAKNFQWGLDRFEREARTLAKFRHPNIVRIFQIFDANDTAYIVLEFVEGADLEAWLRALGRRPTQEELDRLTGPLLEALGLVHAESILHRDVKPQNIYIRKSTGAPVLLDFGAARYATGDLTGTTAAIVSRGYSPHEAYARESKLQGPWSDIYGLAATLYRALHGEAPPESAERVLQDTLVPVARLPLKGYRKDFLKAIDWGLALRPQERPQTVAEWRARLVVSGAQATGTTVPAPSEPASGATSGPPSTPAQTGQTDKRRTSPPSAPRSGTSADTPPSASRRAGPMERPPSEAKVASEPSAPRPAPQPSRLPLVAALGGLLMIGGGATLAAAYLFDWRSGDAVSETQRREAEEQRHREAAALKEAEDERRRLAKLKGDEDERRRLAKLREDEDERRRLAKLREDEDEKRRLAKLREDEDEKRRLAKLREDEDERRRLAKLKGDEDERRRLAKLREDEDERRRLAKLREDEDERRRLAKLREDEDERRRLAKLKEDDDERRRAKLREDEDERRRLAKLREDDDEKRRLAKLKEDEDERRRLTKLKEDEDERRRLAKPKEAEDERRRREAAARKDRQQQSAPKSTKPVSDQTPPMLGTGF
jgi:serine/threonine protein kinase